MSPAPPAPCGGEARKGEVVTMTTTTLDTLRDMIAAANEEGRSGGCPCTAFPIMALPGSGDVVTQLLAELGTAVEFLLSGQPDAAEHHAGHVLVLALATGYAIGAGAAYDVVLSSEVVVPDTLASLDILGDD